MVRGSRSVKVLVRSVVALALLAWLPGETDTARAGTTLWLITPEEAALAPAPESARPQAGRLTDIGKPEINNGPEIEVLKPVNGKGQPAPVEVVIRFLPRLGPVDVSTLKVTVVKIISIDITDRLRPYVTPEGIQIKEAQIPQGKYTVRISLADAAGGMSIAEVTFEVL